MKTLTSLSPLRVSQTNPDSRQENIMHNNISDNQECHEEHHPVDNHRLQAHEGREKVICPRKPK